MAKEYLSAWFIQGLNELGVEENEYRNKMSTKEKNAVKKLLEEMGIINQ